GSQSAPISATEEDHSEFQLWMLKHGKYHIDDEFHYRLAVYLDNREYIRQHNSGNHTFWLAVNQFSDLTHDEFRSMYTMKEGFDLDELEKYPEF
ncbi:MAG: hypothetical protein V2I33_23880, partial [Kangiellaceae bacterium]|nr:hypothetical protein [Kangiellaceae bacterium]